MIRKIFYISLLSVLLVSCGTYKTLDLNKLYTGMTKAEVQAVAGSPNRILNVSQTRDGYLEVLEYRTSVNEVYALEFWDDYLTGYEFLYDDVNYVPAVGPPAYMPPPGRPIIIYPGHHPPGRPSDVRPTPPAQPTPPTRPSTPGNPVRPSDPPTRPSTPGNPGRPSDPPTRPSTPQPSTRPSDTQQPSTRPSQGSSRPAESTTRPETRPSTSESGGRTSSGSSETNSSGSENSDSQRQPARSSGSSRR